MHALEFRCPPGGPAALLERFEQKGRRAAIVGEEGSGKSTLLARLGSELENAGWTVRRFAARPNEEAAARLRAQLREMKPRELLLLDGFDHLPRLARFRLLRHAAKIGGLLATSHRTERSLPTLIDLAPSVDLLEDLARDLAGAEIGGLDLAEIHRRHRGNLRTALRELYDLWAAREGGSNACVRIGGIRGVLLDVLGGEEQAVDEQGDP